MVEYFIENCMHVPCINTCRSNTSAEIFMFSIENGKWQCFHAFDLSASQD